MQTGPKLDKNSDNGQDLVECEKCHRRFKKRGIKIHLSKTACGRNDQTSQRKISKSEDNLDLEANHSGKVVQKRRMPFIVSQTYHNNKLDVKKTERSTSWSDFLMEQTEDEMSSSEVLQPTEVLVEDFISSQPKSQVQKEVRCSEVKPSEAKKMKDTKLTQYFGVKVKGESGLGEWLTQISKLSPKKPERARDEPDSHEDDRSSTTSDMKDDRETKQEQVGKESWLITDQWQEEEGETLHMSKKEITVLENLVCRGSDSEIIADHHLQIRRSDLKSVYKRNYLNDTIIDEYLLMIKERDPESIAVMNSYFYQRLDVLGLDEGFEQTRSWIKEDLRRKETILVPICKNDHWTLVHIDNKEKTVY